jgi:hypothetical protein
VVSGIECIFFEFHSWQDMIDPFDPLMAMADLVAAAVDSKETRV